MIRPETCIEDEERPGGMARWVATCGHGKSWELGATRQMCSECVQGLCSHPKFGVDVEQLRLA